MNLLASVVISAVFSAALLCQGASVNPSTDPSTAAQAKPLRITSILEVPFLTRQGTGTGNDQYVGFMADLLKILATKVGFSYEINLVKDNQYGRQVDDAERWTGMIGELTRQEADLAAASLTVTPARKSVVSFTTPYLTKGLGILTKKPQSGVAPVATVEALSKQTKIKYGVIIGGSTYHFFKDSQVEPYKTMYNFMVDHEDVFVHSIAEGVEKVRSSNGTYAFIAERPAAEYLVQTQCDLMLIGEDFAPRDVAFATSVGSPLTDRISQAVSQLKSDGTVASLYNKWWKSASECHQTNERGALV